MAWLTDWTYRKSHDIAAAAGAGTDYQKRITAHFSAPHYQYSEIEDVDDWLRGCGEHNQRASFYGLGLYWTFFCDDTNIVYKTSTDGVSWSPKILYESTRSRLYPFTLLWDGTYVHTVISVTGTDFLWYRRGTPNLDGTITWDTDSQITTHKGTSPCLAQDTNGNLWLVYWKFTGVAGPFYITKNSLTGATWSNEGGYPLELAAGSGGRTQGSIAALTDGKMYAAYGWLDENEENPSLVYGKLYDGESWGNQETISAETMTVQGGIVISVDAKDDDVYVTYTLLHSGYPIGTFNKRVYGVGWGSDEYISPEAAGYVCGAMTFDPDTDELWYIFAHIADDLIYVRKRTSGVWASAEVIYDFDGIHDLGYFNVCAWRRPWDGSFAIQFDSNSGVDNKAWWLNYANDINEHVYLSEDCRTDFGDVRFTDNDGETLLDYWLQEKTNSDYATFWVKIADDLSTEAQSIYIYYGNAEATYPVGADQDEMDATFLFADHFYGSSLDADKWDLVNTPTINVADSICNVTSGDAAWRGISSDDSFGAYGVAWMSRKQFTINQYNYAGMLNVTVLADDVMCFFCSIDTNESAFTQNEGSGNRTTTHIGFDGNYHNFEATWKSGQCKFYIDGALEASHVADIPDEVLKVWIESYNTSQNSDWVALRKFVDPEPVHGDWGREEEPPSFELCKWRNSNNQIWVDGDTIWFPHYMVSYVREINDGLGIIDVMNRSLVLLRILADGVGSVDNMGRTQVQLRIMADALGITDAITRGQGFARSIVDDIGMVDNVSRLMVCVRSLSETLGLTDAMTSAASYPRTIADGLGITDSIARTQVQARIIADALGIVDDVSRVQIQLRTIADSLGLTDVMSPGQLIVFADAMGMTDAITRTHAQIRTVTDALGITDDLTRIAAYVFTQADDVGIADAMVRVAVALRTINDSVGITDAMISSSVGDLVKAAWAFMIIRQTHN